MLFSWYGIKQRLLLRRVSRCGACTRFLYFTINSASHPHTQVLILRRRGATSHTCVGSSHLDPKRKDDKKKIITMSSSTTSEQSSQLADDNWYQGLYIFFRNLIHSLFGFFFSCHSSQPIYGGRKKISANAPASLFFFCRFLFSLFQKCRKQCRNNCSPTTTEILSTSPTSPLALHLLLLTPLDSVPKKEFCVHFFSSVLFLLFVLFCLSVPVLWTEKNKIFIM